ncbi:MAG TPA: glutamyl-tRNA reductase [Patescibacteria group bacterium]|nr:glutamyl-tRNA reductase [Patescibacteria group bacterium]
MQIVLIGVNHRTAPLELRECVAFNADQAQRAAAEVRERCALEEVVILSTCNRSEVYGVRREPDEMAGSMERFLADFHGISREQLNGCLYFHRDLEAVGHLFRVAAGLDSMLLGEAEILGQVREAYRRASDWDSTGPILNRLFQGAIETGRRVRAETEVGTRPMSAASAGVKLAERVFGDLGGHSALILGAGEAAQQAVEQLRHRGIHTLWIASRHLQHAQALAENTGGESVEWAEFPKIMVQSDILVASVAATDPVVSAELLSRVMAERQNRSIFLLDLGVPRNIEPSSAGLYNLYLYDLDDLAEIVEQNRRAREREVPRAEAIIDAQISKFEAWRAGRGMRDLVDDLRAHLDERRRRILDAHAPTFAHLGSEEREKIDQLTSQLLDELLQQPADRLRHARTWRQRVQHMETLRDLFGLDGENDHRGDNHREDKHREDNH